MHCRISVALFLLLATASFANDTDIAHYDDDWWRQVSRDIRKSEYWLRSSGSGTGDVYSGVNRAQGIIVEVSPHDVSVRSRERQAESWSARIVLVGVEQFGASVTPAVSGTRASGRMVSFDRNGLVQSVENRATGLILGVDFSRWQAFDQDSALVYQLDTALTIIADATASQLGFYRDGARIATLKVRAGMDDSSGSLSLHLVGNKLQIISSARANSVQMVLSSAAATDTQAGPSQTPDWILDEDQPGSDFAFSVAPAGDVDADGFGDVLVGAPDFDIGSPARAGRAVLYRGSASGLLTTPSWTSDGTYSDGRFGASVAAAGDFNGDGFADVVVGTPGANRATVFPGSASGTGSSGIEISGAGGQFGFSVASAGDVDGDGDDDVIIGAPGGASGGSATIHFGPDNSALPSVIGVPPESSCRTFTQFDCDQGAAAARFGHSVASAGDVDNDGMADIIIGAPFYEFGRDTQIGFSCDMTGGAFVFLGSQLSPGAINSDADWCSEPIGGADPQPQGNGNAEIGYSVAGAGDVNADGYDDIIVGSPGWNYEACTQCTNYDDAGAALVYQADPNGMSGLFHLVWAGIGILDDINPVPVTRYGATVSAAGDVNGDGIDDVIVGAPDLDGSSLEQGGAFVYFGSRTSGPDISGLQFSDNQDFGIFGNSALTNNEIALRSAADWSTDGTERRGRLGQIVAAAGDVNGDGYSDLLTASDARASVFRGSATTPYGDRFDFRVTGGVVASAGDVDTDGRDDILIENNGALSLHYGSSTDFGQSWSRTQALGNGAIAFAGAGDINGDGSADIAVGRATGVDIYSGENPAAVAWSIAGSSPGFGSVVAAAGDVNGDGFSDLLVGDPGYTNAQGAVGRTWLFLGADSGFASGTSESDADWVADGETDGALFGKSVSSAGDINADGYSDVAIGAPGFGTGGEGRAFVYLGSPMTPLTALSWSGAGAIQPGAEFGATVAAAGDLDGDGYGDIVVGAPGTELFGEPEVGQVFAYLGSASGLSLVEAWSFDGLQGGDRFGEWIGAIGDTNGDGKADVAVSNLVFLGATQGLSSSPAWSGETLGGEARNATGNADFNGDGFTDVVLAVFPGAVPSVGPRVRIHLGNRVRDNSWAPAGTPRLVMQEDGGSPVAPLGVLTGTSFDIRVQSANRIGEYCLEWEVKPLGEAFDASDIRRGTTQIVDSPAATELRATVGPLDAGTPYRWRARVVSESVTAPRTPWFSITGGVPGAHVVTAGARAPAPFSSIGPAQNLTVFADSEPLFFQWHAGSNSSFEIEWSGNDVFDDPIVTSGDLVATGSDIETYAPSRQQWIEILKLANNPDFREAPIFWRVISDGGVISETRALRLAAAAAPALVSPADGQSSFAAPTVTWHANHNESFQIRFSANDFMGAPLVVVADDDDMQDSTTDFGITGTSLTIPNAIWSSVEALVPPGADGTGIVYFSVRGQDALGRTSVSEVRSLRVNATGTVVTNPAPKKKGGGGTSLMWLLVLSALACANWHRWPVPRPGGPGRSCHPGGDRELR